jgi:ubiquinone/menaquinone biosynthesis C-methylase UbiE
MEAFETGSDVRSPKAIADQMRREWDERARENAEYYVANSTKAWDPREFFRTGEVCVAREILPDVLRICNLRVLEIGCGVGRMATMLARVFGGSSGCRGSPEPFHIAISPNEFSQNRRI